MSSVIFSGDRLKALKNALKLSDKATIFSDNIDPTVTPFNAQKGDVLISTLTGKTYSKADDGLNTNWNYFAVQSDIDAKANVELDNLSSTAVNADIIPATDDGASLGSAAKNWNSVRAHSVSSNSALNLASTDGMNLNAGNNINVNTTSNLTLSPVGSTTVDSGSTTEIRANAGNLTLKTFNSGDINLQPGASHIVLVQASALDMDASPITSVADPTNAQDAATKAYVDAASGSLTTAINTKITGPASATDEAIVRYDGTTGKLAQNSVITATDAGVFSGITQLNVDNLRLDGNTLNATNAGGNLIINPGSGTANVQLNSATQIFYSTGSGYMGGGWAGATNSNPASTGNITISPGNILYFNLTGVSGTPSSIRGIAAPSGSLASKSQFYYLRNNTGVDVPVTNEDSGATAVDRIVTGTGASYIWKQDTVVVFTYDTAATRWRLHNGFINPITSSTDNAIVRWDTTTGQLIQNSSVTVSDTGVIAGITQLDVDNIRIDGNTISSTNTNGDVAIATNGTGNVTLDTEKFRRSKDGTNFVEEEYVDSVTLTASSTVTAYSYVAASYTGAIITSTITNNAGDVRTSSIMISNKSDGSTVTRTDTFNETADVGATTSVDFSTPNIRLRVANANGTNSNMRLDVKLLRV